MTEELLRVVFAELHRQGVLLEGMILKPNMVLPGSGCPRQETVEEVADATVRCLLRTVPAAVPAVAFLSGGQDAELASARLNAMNVRFEIAAAVGALVLVRARHPAAGDGDLARRGGQRGRGAASAGAPGAVQPSGAARRDGGDHGGEGRVARPPPQLLTKVVTDCAASVAVKLSLVTVIAGCAARLSFAEVT